MMLKNRPTLSPLSSDSIDLIHNKKLMIVSMNDGGREGNFDIFKLVHVASLSFRIVTRFHFFSSGKIS